mmetsp:Transcript_20704/g.34169  ORF Transcript_20704/g.34169 Transcript_20704/m.34169 type:complete len:126 (-) Transcript_20704:223-600(-)
MVKFKDTPRCSIPLRNPLTGEFNIRKNKLAVHKIMKKLFPKKAADESWGSWKGPIFGIYMGFNKNYPPKGSSLSVGDTVTPFKSPEESSEIHCQKKDIIDKKSHRKKLLILVLIIILVIWLKKRR